MIVAAAGEITRLAASILSSDVICCNSSNQLDAVADGPLSTTLDSRIPWYPWLARP
jgi:hypothetical protein